MGKYSLRKKFVLINFLCTSFIMVVFFNIIYGFHHEARNSTVKSILSGSTIGHDFDSDGLMKEYGVILSNDWQDFPKELTSSPDGFPPELNELKKIKVKFNEDNKSFFALTKEHEGKTVYSVVKLNDDYFKYRIFGYVIKPYWWVLFSVLIVGIIYFLALYTIVFFLLKPLNKIREMAKSEFNERPNLVFTEFSDIADIIWRGFDVQKELVNNEKKLLQFISHELRTPVASIKSNSDLLIRLLDDQEKSSTVAKRVLASSDEIIDLIETILALDSSEEYKSCQKTHDLPSLILLVSDEMKLYYGARDINLSIERDCLEKPFPLAALKVVVGNVIKNAFQHGDPESEMVVQYSKGILRVANKLSLSKKDYFLDLGYGLGLKLTRRICDNYGWSMEQTDNSDCFIIKIRFWG